MSAPHLAASVALAALANPAAAARLEAWKRVRAPLAMDREERARWAARALSTLAIVRATPVGTESSARAIVLLCTYLERASLTPEATTAGAYAEQAQRTDDLARYLTPRQYRRRLKAGAERAAHLDRLEDCLREAARFAA